MDSLLELIPMPEFLFNALGILLSLIALYYWVRLYKKIYRKKNELHGWVWLFASAFAILLLNMSSTYMLFAKARVTPGIPVAGVVVDFNTLQVLEVLSRTIIVFSMTVGVYLIYTPLKSGFVYALAPVGLKGSSSNKEKLKYSIKECMGYIIPEKTFVDVGTGFAVGDRSSSNTMQVFTDLVVHGVYGLIVTREYPAQVRKNWDVDDLPIIWLTTSKDVETMTNVQYIDPADIVGLSFAIKDFIQKSEDSVVVLDGIEYLITQNSFSEILKFIQSLNDFISKKKTRLVVPLDYKAVGETELHLLKRELCEIRVV